MNNSTIFRCDLTIKLRGDHVYDLYMNGKWVASRGSYENILKEMYDAAKNAILLDDTAPELPSGTKVHVYGYKQEGTIIGSGELKGVSTYAILLEGFEDCMVLSREDFEVIEQ